jgi:hypothetical protein
MPNASSAAPVRRQRRRSKAPNTATINGEAGGKRRLRTKAFNTKYMMCGILFRLGCYAQRRPRLLQGRKFGWPIVSGNIADFDFLNQLVPDGHILLYRELMT